MLTSQPHGRAGFTLIELLIGLVVLGILFMVGLPSLSTWMQSTQVRNSADAMVSGLQLARNEAVRRNQTVQFSLVDSLAASCALSATGTNWVVSLSDPSGLCDQAASETVAPMVMQKRSGTDGSPNAVVTSNVSSVVFNGLGRLASGAASAQIDITSLSGSCQSASGTIRCLRVTVSLSGSVRMCDPAVGDSTDPRYC